jgi:hypothetical protein
MKLVVFAAAGLMFFALFVVWLQTRIQYRIGSKHLKILCLGLTLRRIDLADIKRISKRKPPRLAEYWYSTLKPKHRLLAIQRNGGLRKFVVISPRNRYVFMADLQNAIHRVKPDANLDALIEQTPDNATEDKAEANAREAARS